MMSPFQTSLACVTNGRAKAKMVPLASVSLFLGHVLTAFGTLGFSTAC